MACVLTNGLTRECAHSFGGLKELYLMNYDDIETVVYDATTGQVTGITATTGAVPFEIEFLKDTAQVLEELVINGATSQINQTLNFQANAITQEKKKVLNELSLSTVVAIAKKSDDKYWLIGDPNNSSGLEATTASNDTGTAQSDAAIATFTMVGASIDYGDTIEDSVVTGLLAG